KDLLRACLPWRTSALLQNPSLKTPWKPLLKTSISRLLSTDNIIAITAARLTALPVTPTPVTEVWNVVEELPLLAPCHVLCHTLPLEAREPSSLITPCRNDDKLVVD